MILLFTDFGRAGFYVGQMKAALVRTAPEVPVIDLMHDAPRFDARAAAYLLAALAGDMAEGTVCLAVVDPGVGGDRPPVVVAADGRWFVGPGAGLFEIVQRRAARARQWVIAWRPERLSDSFHGRDLFVPVAARLARGEAPPGRACAAGWRQAPRRPGAEWPDDLAAILHIDDFGNAITGIRAATLAPTDAILAGGRSLPYARVFAEVPAGAVFWYSNSCGLAEIAANCGNAAQILGLGVGDVVTPGRA